MDKEDIKIIRQKFIHYLEGTIPDWLVPAEKFFNSFNNGIKSFLKNRGVRISNILEIQDINILKQWRMELQQNDAFVYAPSRRPTKRLEGLKFYIAFLQDQQSNTVDESEKTPEINEVDNYDDVMEYIEGEDTDVESKRYERSQRARKKCIQEKGCKCYVCQFDFEAVYGKELGEGFIEIHHVVPLAVRSQMEGAYHLNPITDLVPLCSNCHSMVHKKRGQVMDVDDLKEKYNKMLLKRQLLNQ